MAYQRIIKRYAAYYMGWCQAFGEHELVEGRGTTIQWLVGEGKVGLILPRDIRKLFLRALVSKRRRHPTLVFRKATFEIAIDESVLPIVEGQNPSGLQRLMALLDSDDDVHMFLAKHFFYPPGTRIVSFSSKRPLTILYKEMDPLRVRVV